VVAFATKKWKTWKHSQKVDFFLSFDGTDSDQGLEMVKDAIEFLAFTMKKGKQVQLVDSCWIILKITQLVSTDR
jgi:hypothetical protein